MLRKGSAKVTGMLTSLREVGESCTYFLSLVRYVRSQFRKKTFQIALIAL